MATHFAPQVAPNFVHSTMQSNSADDSFTFTVGKLDAGMAILIGEKASLIEFPSLLLPPGVASGSVVNIRVLQNHQQEKRQKQDFDQLQEDILHTFGQQSPKPPALRLRNVTQTSVTLEWDRLFLATASLLSLDIYRNGQRLAPIPNPLHNTSTKLSGLDVNAEYTFHLVLKTTAGTFSSPVIKTKTHTINDTSGISACFGHVSDPEVLEAAKQALTNMKAKFSDKIQIETSHYICTDPRSPGDVNAAPGSQGPGYAKAMQLSIPAVLPHWVLACHDQKKMVGISPFYLDQDPPNAATMRESVNRVLGKTPASASATATATANTTDTNKSAQPEASSSSSSANAPPPPLEKSPKIEPISGVSQPDDAVEPINSEPGSHLAEGSDSKAQAQEQSSSSALGLNLTGQPTTSIPTITTSAPDDEPDAATSANTATGEATDSAANTRPPPPQLIITSSESEPQNLAATTSQHQAHDDEEDEGEMDDVSLGGNGDVDNSEDRDEADTRLV